MGGCTGHCCINRFGELGVATPEGTAHVRIDYTTPSPRTISLPVSFFLSFSLSLSLFFTLSRLGPLLEPPPSGDGFDSPLIVQHIPLFFSLFLSFFHIASLFFSVLFSFSR